ncbi:class A sortase [Streptococcus dysgalactiae subsp. equisimilis]|uniref:class A sortase n=1 Tax=Streptococcus dysgalactiae TaxID=1334 RepID=UPI000806F6CE|nr:class A sortase [Streptococcus dysgalactiae]OBZ00637.1 class A sortase [Streptococcus dysgalactiae subsp. equisimilis]
MKIVKHCLLIFLSVLALVLIFNRSIRNMMIGYKSNQYQVTQVSKKEVEENNRKKTSFNFEKVESISTESVLKSQMDSQKLPVIGGIAIPDLAVNLPIFKGLGNVELTYGAGTMKENQKMGEVNNYSLAGHHVFGMTGSSEMLFSPLENAKVGMPVYLTDKQTIFHYEVIEVKDVAPEQVEVIEDVPGERLLTLITCSDVEATGRTVVVGRYRESIFWDKADRKILSAFKLSYNQ